MTSTQIGYSAWYAGLVKAKDILVHPKLAAGVVVPHEGLEAGPAVFVIPEPSRKRVVNEVMEDACDAIESVSGDSVVGIIRILEWLV